jgi:hypothetical protein
VWCKDDHFPDASVAAMMKLKVQGWAFLVRLDKATLLVEYYFNID